MAAFNINIGDGSSYSSVIAAEAGKVAWWRMNESSGTTLTDQVSGRVITLAGTAGTDYSLNTTGLAGTASGGSLTVNATASTPASTTQANNPVLSLGSTWSVECWLRCDTYPTGGDTSGRGVFAVYDGDSGSATRLLVLTVGNFNSARLRIGVTIGDGTRTVSMRSASNSFSLGKTHHVVVTYDGTGVRVYLNGRQSLYSAQASANPAFTGYSPPTTGQLWLGTALAGGTSAASKFGGAIDELVFYNTVLTAAQVSTHYDAGAISAGASNTYGSLGPTGLVQVSPARSVEQEVIGTDERVLRVRNPAARSSANLGRFPSSGTATANFADGPGGSLTTCLRYVEPAFPSSGGGNQLLGLSGTDSASTFASVSNLRNNGWASVRPGQQIAVSFWFKCDSSVGAQSYVYYRSGSGVWVTVALGPSRQLPANEWVFISNLFTVPANAEWALLWPRFTGLTTGAAYDFRTTGHVIEEANTVQPYFDGSTPGARWFGTADQSASGYPLIRTTTTGSRGRVNIGTADTYKAKVVADGAIARWGMDEETGATLTDDIGGRVLSLSGTANTDFVRNHPPLIPGVGESLRLNGTASGHAIGSAANNPLLNLTAWTIEMWVRSDRFSAPTDGNYGTTGLLNAWQNDVSTTFQGVSIYWQGNTVSNLLSPEQRIAVEIGTGTALTNASTLSLLGALAPAQAYHVVATYSGGTLAIYLNGRLGHQRTGLTYSAPTTGSLRLGLYSSLTGNKWTGAMDELAIYNTALTAAQVRDHYDRAGVFASASESGRRAVTASRTLADPAQASDAATDQVALPRATADTLTVSDAATRLAAEFRQALDSITITNAALAQLIALFRSFADSLTVSEAVGRTLGLPRGLTDQAGVVDAAIILRSLLAKIADSLTIQDSTSLSRYLTRATTDPARANDSVARVLNSLRGLSEQAIADAIFTTLRSFTRSLVDAAGVTDTAGETTGATRPITDALGFQAVFARELALPRTTLDYASWLDTAVTQLIPGIVGATSAIIEPHRAKVLLLDHLAAALVDHHVANASVADHLAEVSLR